MRRFPDTNPQYIRDVSQDHPYQASASLTALERRLNDGYVRIERARTQGEDVSAWEDFWIDLLRQYEATVDALPEAA